MTRAFIGLGSNVGDRLDNINRAVAALAEIGPVHVSGVYETEPVGPAQSDFLNAVASLETPLRPRALLAALKDIESAIGRVDRERWGPREIDLDLLLYGDEVVDEPGLVVPHPELTKRAFVLVPLVEIAPDVRLPDGRALADLARDVDARGVRNF